MRPHKRFPSFDYLSCRLVSIYVSVPRYWLLISLFSKAHGLNVPIMTIISFLCSVTEPPSLAYTRLLGICISSIKSCQLPGFRVLYPLAVSFSHPTTRKCYLLNPSSQQSSLSRPSLHSPLRRRVIAHKTGTQAHIKQRVAAMAT